MAGEWREARFGEVAGILPGKYIPASDYDPAGGYLIYGSNSIMGRVRLPLYEGPIIAFARIGSNCGATMYSAAPCWINNNAAGIRAKAGCDTRFLYYWMQSFDFAQTRRKRAALYQRPHTQGTGSAALAAPRTTRYRPHSGDAGRQHRVEPPDERDAGGHCPRPV